MKRYVEGENRSQSTLLPERPDDYIAEDNPVRVVDVFVDELDLTALGFDGAEPEVTLASSLLSGKRTKSPEAAEKQPCGSGKRNGRQRAARHNIPCRVGARTTWNADVRGEKVSAGVRHKT